jgi:phospholipid/cholesterol/gamma-HCH transport system permease protein
MKFKTFIVTLGKKTMLPVLYFGSLACLSYNSFTKLTAKKKTENLMTQIDKIGINSFPLVGTIAIFTGMVLVMETAHTLKKFGAEIYAGGIVSISMIRELGPVIVALVLAGRIGASIAAEIGMMKITEQVDALKVMAADPVSCLISPRLLAGIISMPALFILSFFLAILGGYIVGVFMVGIPSGLFFYQSFRFVSFKDFLVGIIKVVVFAFIIINTSSHEGLRAKGGAEGVGKAATSAVVVSFLLIILANFILTGLFYFI